MKKTVSSNRFSKWMAVAMSAALLLTATACGKGDSGKSAATPDSGKASSAPVSTQKDPITLTVYPYSGSFTQDEFNQYFAAPVQKKFPYITLKYVTGKVDDLITAGSFPDIGMTGIGQMPVFTDAALPLDLKPLMKKLNLDTSKYRDDGLKLVNGLSDKGELLALPMWINFYMTIYNKDIFDKTGSPYPKDGMTWDDMKQLATRVTRKVDGVQYKGLQFGSVQFIAQQEKAPEHDPTGLKPVFDTPVWVDAFKLGKDIYSLPGNEPKDKTKLWKAADDFFTDSNIAMVPYFGSRLTRAATLSQDKKLTFDWDVVSFPSNPKASGYAPQADAQVFFVNKTSKNTEDALRVISFMTSDPEPQGMIAKIAKALPAAKMDNLDQTFGTEFPILKTKNIKGILQQKVADRPTITKYDSIFDTAITNAFNGYVSSSEDVNTVLQKAMETATKGVQDAQAKQK